MALVILSRFLVEERSLGAIHVIQNLARKIFLKHIMNLFMGLLCQSGRTVIFRGGSKHNGRQGLLSCKTCENKEAIISLFMGH